MFDKKNDKEANKLLFWIDLCLYNCVSLQHKQLILMMMYPNRVLKQLANATDLPPAFRQVVPTLCAQ